MDTIMLILINPKLKVAGMAIWPFIILKNKEDVLNERLINHEKIHLKQEFELLIVVFYLVYLLHYLFNRIKKMDHDKAYRNIVFEKEAYLNQDNLGYLKERKPYAFIKYFSLFTGRFTGIK